MDPEVALADFKQRVKAYEAVYEELGDDEDEGGISYIKVYNVGRKVVTRNTTGYIPSQVCVWVCVFVVFFCMCVCVSVMAIVNLFPDQHTHTHPHPHPHPHTQIAFYLQNIHIEPRKIWLTRHAESLDQVSVCVCVCVCMCMCILS
jgi:hypothetical protein